MKQQELDRWEEYAESQQEVKTVWAEEVVEDMKQVASKIEELDPIQKRRLIQVGFHSLCVLMQSFMKLGTEN